ncbi:MAG: restriction endonuclease subunit S [Paludibacter sp.]|nr:restriction endonuclease subunit S [Paludibacter sp.]
MNKENIIVPKLRFPEFQNEPEWTERKLSDVLDEHGLKSIGNEEVFSVSVHKGIINQIEHLGRSYSASNTDNYKRVLPGDIIYTKSPTGDFPYGIIKQSKVEFPVIVSPLYGVFTPETTGLGCILDAYFESPSNVHNYLASIIQKGAKNTINIANNTFLSKELYLPKNKDEQQKIADCLSSLDEVIYAHIKKLEALKDHKKGLMQQLFPTVGETVPKLRFKEFEKDGKWVEKKLGEVATFLKGKGISKAEIFENGNLPCIRYGELYTHYNETIDIIKSYTNLSADDLVLSKANDVIIPASGETQIDIATASCVLKNGIALGGDLNIIRSKINGVFLSYYLNNARKLNIAQMAQGISVVHLYPNQLKTLRINIPNPNEQQKIANFVSSIDEQITTQVQKIEVFKKHKRGLMQGLFPNIN